MKIEATSNYALTLLSSLPLKCEEDPLSIRSIGGFPLKAPESFWKASHDERNMFTGGCGPGGKGDYVVPDTIWFLNIKLACQIHDWTYFVWNTDAGFALSNHLFQFNINQIIKEAGGPKNLQKLRRARGRKYVWAVTKFGESSFFDSHLEYTS